WTLWEPRNERAGRVQTSVEEPPAKDVVVSMGPGYRAAQHGLPGSTSSTGSDEPVKDPVQFRWKRVALYEPHSGERIEMDMPEVIVAVNDLTITMSPDVPADSMLKSDSASY